MKLAVSANGPGLDAQFNERFGRCSWFVFSDNETGEVASFPNPASNSSGGAGTQASQFIVGQGVHAVISGRIGPKAYRALKSAGIDMYCASGNLVSEVLGKYAAGLLEPISEPDGYGGGGGRRHRRGSGL